MVWFNTGIASNATFNALKSNNIQVYPGSTKQYIGNSWVDKTAKSYIGGKWISFETYLYNSGNQCTSTTGGWINKTFFGIFNVSYNSDNIYCEPVETSAGGGGAIFTANKIKISGSKLTLTFSSSRLDANTILFVSTAQSDDDFVCSRALGATGNNVSVSLDISGISGEYYVGVRGYTASGNTNFTMHKLVMS